MPSITRNGYLPIVLAVLALGWQPVIAQDGEADATDDAAKKVETLKEVAKVKEVTAVEGDFAAEEEVPEDSVSGALDDSTGSIEAAHDPLKHLLYQGWSGSGDFRFGYVRSETDARDGSEGTTSDWRARLRYGGTYSVNDWLTFNGRFATACTSRECDPELSLDPSETQVTTVDQGTITFDEFYLHAFRLKRFDVAIGRLQTKFVTRAGVYAKSLDRNNSNAVNINWTDGIHGTYHLPNESIIHFIAEYNDKNGASNVRRSPLDFSRSSARWGYFASWESLKKRGPITQRGIDITYLPSSLPTEGDLSGPVDDYIGIVARAAAARPFGDKGRRWNLSGEIGYAPETPTESALNLAGDGDVDGLAWAVTASVMDLWPEHSIGLNYARTDAGWLLSPQYRNNEELFEIRYMWRRQNGHAIEVRARWREDLEQQVSQARKRDEFDFFARITMGF